MIQRGMKRDRMSSVASTGFGAENDQPFIKKLKSVVSNRIFLAFCSGLTGLYFVVTGVQYWTPDYLKNIIGQDEAIVAYTFSVTSATAPVGGVIIGGIVI